MLIIDEERANSILNNSENLVNKLSVKNGSPSEVRKETEVKNFEVKTISHGGGVHKDRLTEEERIMIGAVARAGLGTLQEVADEFRISKQHAFNLSHGRVDTPGLQTVDHSDLKAHIENRLKPIQDKAIDKLMESLGLLSPEKMDKCGAKDLSTISANLSKVVSNTMPKDVNQDNRTQIVMYAPKMKDVDEFKVVEI